MKPSGDIALLGSVGHDTCPPFATEAEYQRAYEANGVEVSTYYERDPDDWRALIRSVRDHAFRFVQWTSVPKARHSINRDLQTSLGRACESAGVPLVAVHLDRFWGIRERERWIKGDDPYFHAPQIMLTADGGSDKRWVDAGIKHRWLLPAVSEAGVVKGTRRPELEHEIVFVGSWSRYHNESTHRFELVRQLSRTYGKRVAFLPRRGDPAIRGQDLNDLYWSAKAVVGDSFLAGRQGIKPPSRYGSDRTPETLGRGGILIHPAIEGWNQPGDPFDTPATFTWGAWRWNEMRDRIDEVLSLTPAARGKLRAAAQRHIKEHHTYEVRVREIFAALAAEGLL